MAITKIHPIRQTLGKAIDYILNPATHIDKDHIHNHIIFNHTNCVTYKAFRMNMSTYKEIRSSFIRNCS